jgi:hypothetical protein
MDICNALMSAGNYSPSNIEAIKGKILNDAIYYTTIPVLVSYLLRRRIAVDAHLEVGMRCRG